MIVGTNRDRATGSSASVFGTAFTVLLTGLSFVATSRHLDRAMDLSWWLTLGVLGVIALSTHLIVAGGRGWRSVLVARIVVVLCAGGIGTQVVLGSTGRGLMMAVWLAVGIAVGDVVGRVLVRIPRPHWVWWIGGVTLVVVVTGRPARRLPRATPNHVRRSYDTTDGNALDHAVSRGSDWSVG